MYLITDEQFNDVVMQENENPVSGWRCIPAFDQSVGQREFRLSGNPWYGRILNIGSEGGYPVLTFTTARADLQAKLIHQRFLNHQLNLFVRGFRAAQAD
jgi:hypothetical protein